MVEPPVEFIILLCLCLDFATCGSPTALSLKKSLEAFKLLRGDLSPALVSGVMFLLVIGEGDEDPPYPV